MNHLSVFTAIYRLKQFDLWEIEENSLRFHHYRAGFWFDYFEFPITIYFKNSNDIVYRPNRFTQLFIRYYVNKLKKRVEKLEKHIYRCKLCNQITRSNKNKQNFEQSGCLCFHCLFGYSSAAQKKAQEDKQVELMKRAIRELEQEKKNS